MQRLQSSPYICARCIRSRGPAALLPNSNLSRSTRLYSEKARRRSEPESPPLQRPAAEKIRSSTSSSSPPKEDATDTSTRAAAAEPSAMSRRLEEATEEVLLTGGRAGQRAVEEAGFSDELKERLYEKVASAHFRTRYSRAFAEAGVVPGSTSSSSSNDGGSSIITGGGTTLPWTGEERADDVVRRMLEDSRKPLAPELRGKFQPPDPTRGGAMGPPLVDLRIKKETPLSRGQRAASARERAAAYVGLGLGKGAEAKGVTKADVGLTQQEKEAVKKEFRERFAPGARSVSSISGIAALANERIEDAIARGQFKNIPRGPGVERDARADNPFIDTTEYIMNNMIKRQEIVPPWIEKQQQLAKDAKAFRSRLRRDWLRHAARTMASGGGTLDEKVARAEAYARAEAVRNPPAGGGRRRRNPEDVVIVSNATDDPVMVKVRQTVDVTTAPPPSATAEQETSAAAAVAGPGAGAAENSDGPAVVVEVQSRESPGIVSGGGGSGGGGAIFRDLDWEAAELRYLTLAVDGLNSTTRSYNLMAPELAKKPYFSLSRELRTCFADVAPLVGPEIRARAATRPVAGLADGVFAGVGRAVGGGGAREGRVRVIESKDPHYGLKEMWRDWWGKPAQ